MAGPNFTRRDALRLGAGAVAVSTLRVSPAAAASFSLTLPEGGAHASSAWRTTPVLKAPPPLRPRGSDVDARGHPGAGPSTAEGRPLDRLVRASRARRARARRRACAERHRPRVHGRGGRTPVPAAGSRERPDRAVRARAHGRAARARARRPGLAAHHHLPHRVGRRLRAAARRADVRRRAGRVRPPHGRHERLRAFRQRRHRARHRALSPRHQRLERHRLQLPRRQVRPGLRRPCGRDRVGRGGRPGAGLQRAVDRHRVPRARSRPLPRPRPGWTRWRG